MKMRTCAVLFILMMALPLTAQSGGERGESEYYALSVPIERIYNYHLGYIITYRKGPLGVGQVYLPFQWFESAASKGEMVSITAPGAWPYMVVYYKNREFSHVKIAVRPNRAHESWGYLPNRADLDSHFEGVETLQIEFQ